MLERPKLVISGPIFELYTYRSAQPLFTAYDRENTEFSRKRSKQRLIRTINANAGQWFGFNGPYLPQFYTFTFANPPESVSIASAIFHRFIKRFTYSLYATKKAVLKYTTVIEFQEKRGIKYGIEPPIHYHTLFYNLPYIQDIKKLHIDTSWKEGFVFVRSVENVLNAGQYVAKYLAKSDRDHRLFQKKNFFSSKGLIKPVIITNEFTIADYLSLVPDPEKCYSFDNDDMEYKMYNMSLNKVRYLPLLVKKMKDKVKLDQKLLTSYPQPKQLNLL
jgi:hypothetical protein